MPIDKKTVIRYNRFKNILKKFHFTNDRMVKKFEIPGKLKHITVVVCPFIASYPISTNIGMQRTNNTMPIKQETVIAFLIVEYFLRLSLEQK